MAEAAALAGRLRQGLTDNPRHGHFQLPRSLVEKIADALERQGEAIEIACGWGCVDLEAQSCAISIGIYALLDGRLEERALDVARDLAKRQLEHHRAEEKRRAARLDARLREEKPTA